MSTRPFLFDVSRLIWRIWNGRLPTGIDRVCLAYMEHYGPRALAFVQRGEHRIVLNARSSDRLFALLGAGPNGFRPRFLRLMAGALLQRQPKLKPGMLYLNIGHTGLNAAGLPAWLERHALRPIYLIHDLIPITHPQYCRPGEAERHADRMLNVLASAAGIIGNSAATLDALADFARANGYPALPPAVTAWLAASHPAEPAPVDRPQNPYFVVIGTIEARKNHLLLLRLWEKLVDERGAEAPVLLLIGQRGWEANDVFAILDHAGPAMKRHVIELGRCSDGEMVGYLDGARALLMPSFVEGFGLPVIEALQRRVPVIASDLPVYREIAGEIPLYLGADDLPAWEHAVLDYCTDSAGRTRQIAAAADFHEHEWPEHFAIVDAWLAEHFPGVLGQ